LVKACRENRIPVTTAPGASSLMSFLSLCGERIDQFWFEGFLPANTELRHKRLQQMQKLDTNLILMDTPYRLIKTLENCEKHFAKRKLVLGASLTQPTEVVLTGSADEIKSKLKSEKAEFVLAVLKKP
jgi:16S rRNA (cytidine1402-2'-O)-methyltransferase